MRTAPRELMWFLGWLTEWKGILCKARGGIDTPLIFSLENPRFLSDPNSRCSRAPQDPLKRCYSRGEATRRPRGPNTWDSGPNRLVRTSRSGRPGSTADWGDIDQCMPCLSERLSTPSDKGYAPIMLRGSTTLKTTASMKMVRIFAWCPPW
jgi:hypothetical protein